MMDCFQAPFAIWILDKTFKVLSCNLSAIHLGSTPFLGLTTEDEALLKMAAQTNDGKSLSLKWESQGKTTWHHWHIWKEEGNYYFSADDVTLIKDDELYLRQILDAIPDMILVKGKGSRILWANKAFQDFYGMTIQQLAETIDAPFQEPEHTRQFVIDDAWVWNHKKPLFIDVEPVTSHDGVIRNFQTLKSPILDKNGDIKMTVGISRDITEKLEYEQKSFASSKLASLGEMAGGIAHEINNPIGIITGKIYQMKRDTHDTKILKDLEMISRNSDRIAKIVEGLRNFFKRDDEKVFIRFNVLEVLNETLAYCQGRLDFLRVNLTNEVGSDLFMVGNRIQISQILLNLLNNAIDAIQGIENKWIKVSGSEVNGFVEIRVQDSGPGVPLEIESKIMQPFFTTKEIGKGIGLGLSVSFAIAKQHGGELSLDRKVSPSCFVLKIPSAN